MIQYVEEKQNPDKVLRETKFLPKLVLRIETFNKYVIWLGKKTKYDLVQHLHIGRVRFFRIQDLQDALDKTLQEGQIEEENESNLDEQEKEDDSNTDSESNLEGEASESSNARSSPTSSGTNSEVGLRKSKLMRNMEQINKNARKKRVRMTSDNEKRAPPSKRNKKLKK